MNDPVCTHVIKGKGTVTHILSSDYSVMQMDPGAEFAEGDSVER
jgi:hypothetical protein